MADFSVSSCGNNNGHAPVLCGGRSHGRRALTSLRSSALSSSPAAAGFLALTLETLGATLATGGLGVAAEKEADGLVNGGVA